MVRSPLLKVGVVGATGVVGQEFLKILEERKFPVQELRPFGGTRSEGTSLQFRGEKTEILPLSDGCFKGLDLVFFSAGGPISEEWAPKAVEDGAFAIDNSSAFRMDPEILLCVPEVNGKNLPPPTKPAIIANPNCSTIQLVVALKPLQDKFGLEEVRVATYQAVSGAGRDGIEEFIGQARHVLEDPFEKRDIGGKAFPHAIAFNPIPQIGEIGEDGFCVEETKMMAETKKILGNEYLRVSAFTVRVPVLNSHSEAAWVTLSRETRREDILSTLRPAGGIEILDEPFDSKYPIATQANGQDPVYIGRIHQDPSLPRTWLMWIVADNLRKGAALNGVQIAEAIFDLQRTT